MPGWGLWNTRFRSAGTPVVASHCPDIDLDLLLSGAVLHDVGKTGTQLPSDFAIPMRAASWPHDFELEFINEISQIDGFPRGPLTGTAPHHFSSQEYEFQPQAAHVSRSLVLHCLDNLDGKLEA
jgi:hypothetical protein